MNDNFISGLIDRMSLNLRERLVIVYDQTTVWLAEEISSRVNECFSEKPVTRVFADKNVYENYTPLISDGNAVVLRILEKTTPMSSKIRAMANEAGCLCGGISAPSHEMLQNLFRVPSEYLDHITNRIFEEVSDTDNHTLIKAIKIQSDAGTDLTVKFSTDFQWARCTGKLDNRINYTNLVPGEVYTHPESVDGIAVLDAFYSELTGPDDEEAAKLAAKMALNPPTIRKRLKETPIIWKISDGLIKNVQCEDKSIERLAKCAAFSDSGKHSNRIGEFALPTNPFVRLVGSVLPDEKRCVHIAHGHGYPLITGAQYDSPYHADAGMTAPTITIEKTDGSRRLLMKDGRYDPELLKKTA